MLLSVAPIAGAQVVDVEEYALIGYEQEARDNRIARLVERMESGEVSLHYEGGRGYLDSFLRELDIDPDSQALVFSKTSLQYPLISALTPRAIYFNDDTYIGFVQNSTIVEIATLDERFGTVFYVFNNTLNAEKPVERINQKCLVCHDTYGMMGGGVPVLMVRSSVYTVTGQNVQEVSGEGNSEDSTPLPERWGGWYLTGQHGAQEHLGNVQLPGPGKLAELDDYRIGNIDSLAGQGFFDTSPYLRATSDIVSLMVMEHQVAVQNQLTYVKFKAPIVLERLGMGEVRREESWNAMPERARRALTRMIDELVDDMLFVGAIRLADPVSGNPGYSASFQARGPFDALRRSLRELDLETRMFRYPFSYLVYSPDFATLPPYVLDYMLIRFSDVLEGRDNSEKYDHLSEADRRAIAEILRDTNPLFEGYLSGAMMVGVRND